MTIYDIAKQAGVSIATVSRVLNGSPNVSPKTKEKVLDIIDALGYTPNIFARGLGLNSIKMVGVLCTDVADIYYAKAFSFIENALRQNGFDALLCCTGDDISQKKKYLDLLLAKRVDAIILVGSPFTEQNDNSHIEAVAEKVPVILINGFIPHKNIYCISCDEVAAMHQNVSMLLNAGRKHILYLYDADTYSGLQKLEGYKAGLIDHGKKIRPHYIVKVSHNMEAISETVTKVLTVYPNISAILASEDFLAIGAMKAIRGLGYHIPQDLPVIGFNNSLLCECSSPRLSSVDNCVDILCSNAVSTLIDVFAGKSVTNKIMISSHFIERESFKL
jgi:LacI family transcriptional regulator/LacI family asc operon transcriptional repressor